MLVFAKNPRGVLYLGSFQIWGKETGREPSDIPFELYTKCKDGLQDAAYREGYLQKIFGKPFKEVAFTYSEVKFLPESTLDHLCQSMSIDFKKLTKKVKIDAIKRELKNVSPST